MVFSASNPDVTDEKSVNKQIEQALNEVKTRYADQNALLVERLGALDTMLDQRGWLDLYNYDSDGPSLDQIKEASGQIRNLMALNPTIKRGSQLRISYVHSKGINFGEIPGSGRGRGTNVKAFFDLPQNQKYVFSPEAREELERTAYSDGSVFLIADEATKAMQRIPIWEINGYITNPDNAEEIWAYRRTWNSYAVGNVSPEQKNVWYYTDQFVGNRTKTVTIQGKSEPVDQKSVIIDHAFNKQVGWAWGLPDAISILSWAKQYRDFLLNGKIMSDSLAQFAFKAVAQSRAGGDNASMKLAAPGSAGSTAVLGGGNDLVPISSAGKGYDFDSGRALAAQIAAGLEVSLVHLLSDPGASGSSYGSASNLDLPTKRAMLSRQRSWVSFYTRVLKFLGWTEPTVSFPTLDEPDYYREIQALLLAWASGELHHDEFRPRLLDLLDVQSKHDNGPEGVLLPNNENSLARKDIDTDGTGGASTQGQGSSSPVGQGVNANDLRSDTLANSLRMHNPRVAEMLEEIKTWIDNK